KKTTYDRSQSAVLVFYNEICSSDFRRFNSHPRYRMRSVTFGSQACAFSALVFLSCRMLPPLVFKRFIFLLAGLLFLLDACAQVPSVRLLRISSSHTSFPDS